MVITVLCLLAWAQPRTGAERKAKIGSGTFSGAWSGGRNAKGLSGTGSGSISFNINADKGSFSCTFKGTGQFSGTLYGSTKVTGTNTMKSTSCSGSYDAASGSVSGSISISESWSAHSTWTSDGKTKSQDDRGSESYGGSLNGAINNGGGSGGIEYSGGGGSWSVSGTFSGGGDADESVAFENLSPDDKVDLVKSVYPHMTRAEILNTDDKTLKTMLGAEPGAGAAEPEAASPEPEAQGGDTGDTVDFNDLSQADKNAILGALMQDMSEKEILSMTPEDLQQAMVDKLDAVVESPQGHVSEDVLTKVEIKTGADKVAREVERPQPGREGITHEQLFNDIMDINKPEVQKALIDQFATSADAKMQTLQKEMQAAVGKLEQKTSLVDTMQKKVASLFSDKDVGEKVAQSAFNRGKQYVYDTLAEGIKKIESVGAAYEKGSQLKEYYDKGAGVLTDLRERNREVMQYVKNGEMDAGAAYSLKGMYAVSKGVTGIVGYVPVVGGAAQEVTQGGFDTMMNKGIQYSVLKKTRNDMVDTAGNASLEGRKEHINDFKKKTIERPDPLHPGKTKTYEWNKKKECWTIIPEQKKEIDWYDSTKNWIKEKMYGPSKPRSKKYD
jgi:hypothetical protein